MSPFQLNPSPWRARVPAVAACGFLALALGGCAKTRTDAAGFQTEPVTRRSITVTVEATGTVEPINLVEVKSKASGQIVQMPVEIGTAVAAGDLLVQVDPRDVQNSFDQAQAALVAAEARAEVARLQRARADKLFAEQVITATEHEAAMLDDATARSQLVTARTNLDIARQRLEEATVRAPIAGTVLGKPVSVGQVISSATSSVSGGTTLLTMADLDRVRMRTLVVETDIGRVKPGQPVTVVVDAHPTRAFRGEVEKIEPQAIIQQSITMFPVLVSINNDEGLLLPGMNGEVTVLVSQATDALTVPVDAVRGMMEMREIVPALGLDLESLRGGRPAGARDQAATAPGTAQAAPVDSARHAQGRARRAAADGGTAGGATQPGGRQGGTPAGGGRAGPGAAHGHRAAGGGSAVRPQFVVVKTQEGYAPRMVRIGVSDYDHVEILGGLEEGDQVLLLGVIEMTQQREALQNRIRSRVGGGVTQQSNGSRSSGSNR